jgi:hypothetical protein
MRAYTGRASFWQGAVDRKLQTGEMTAISGRTSALPSHKEARQLARAPGLFAFGFAP